MKNKIYSKEVEDKFWSKVDVREEDDCWNWNRATSGSMGYGIVSINKKLIVAHRVAWQITHGEIPEGMHICHSCDNPRCCNPAHLFLGSRFDNMLDCCRKNRQDKKLEPEQVNEIRRRYSSVKTTYKKLAKEFGVSRQNIGCVIRGDTWKHLLNPLDSKVESVILR